MRTTPEPQDRELPTLGQAIRPPAPQPKSQKTDTPGILRQPDGRLETSIDTPSQPRTFVIEVGPPMTEEQFAKLWASIPAAVTRALATLGRGAR